LRYAVPSSWTERDIRLRCTSISWPLTAPPTQIDSSGDGGSQLVDGFVFPLFALKLVRSVAASRSDIIRLRPRIRAGHALGAVSSRRDPLPPACSAGALGPRSVCGLTFFFSLFVSLLTALFAGVSLLRGLRPAGPAGQGLSFYIRTEDVLASYRLHSMTLPGVRHSSRIDTSNVAHE